MGRLALARRVGVALALGFSVAVSAPPATASIPAATASTTAAIPAAPCLPATAAEPLPPPGDGAGAAAHRPTPDPASSDQASPADYRHALMATPYGWPRRHHWCVWLEPASGDAAARRWEQAWREAVDAALASWGELVAITLVPSPEQAQVRIHRRRPPLRGGRASHGRAELALLRVQRGDATAIEPQVTVQISAGQRQPAIQATALHELGHAFGLWGHSDAPGDAMAAVPGPTPVLSLSARDRATFRWLQQQPGLGEGSLR